MERKFNYFYKIQNKINGKFYFGVHKTDNLEDGYMGSGTRILRAIKKYGIENFNKEILSFFDTFNAALEFESEIVNEVLLMDPSCYNLRLGGDCHWHYYNLNKLNVNHAREGKANWIDLKTNKIVFASSKEENLKFKNDNNYIGLSKGKVVVKDSNNNIFLVSINDERYLSGKLKHVLCGFKHSIKTREQMRLSHHINGDQKGMKNSQYGTSWITNGKENKKIHKDDSIPKGWKLGRKIKFN